MVYNDKFNKIKQLWKSDFNKNFLVKEISSIENIKSIKNIDGKYQSINQ